MQSKKSKKPDLEPNAMEILARVQAALKKAQDSLDKIDQKTQEIYLDYKQAMIKRDIATLEAVKKIHSEESELST